MPNRSAVLQCSSRQRSLHWTTALRWRSRRWFPGGWFVPHQPPAIHRITAPRFVRPPGSLSQDSPEWPQVKASHRWFDGPAAREKLAGGAARNERNHRLGSAKHSARRRCARGIRIPHPPPNKVVDREMSTPRGSQPLARRQATQERRRLVRKEHVFDPGQGSQRHPRACWHARRVPFALPVFEASTPSA